MHYGFPPFANGKIKVAKHHHSDEAVDPDHFERAVSAADEALIRAALADHIPAANGPLAAAKTCLYTVTPDRDFLVDGCERIGYHCRLALLRPRLQIRPVVGEILADLATAGATRHDISRFKLALFG